LTGFISAAVHNLTIDQTMTEGTMVNLAREFHNFPPGSLKSVTFPTVGPYVTSGGADVLLPAATADDVVIKNFLAFGTHATTTPTTTTRELDRFTTGMTSTPESLAWSAILAGVTSTTTPAGAPTTTTTSNQTMLRRSRRHRQAKRRSTTTHRALDPTTC